VCKMYQKAGIPLPGIAKSPQSATVPSQNGTSNHTVQNGNATPALSWKEIYEAGKPLLLWETPAAFCRKVALLFQEEQVNKTFLDTLDAIQLGWLKNETVGKQAAA